MNCGKGNQLANAAAHLRISRMGHLPASPLRFLRHVEGSATLECDVLDAFVRGFGSDAVRSE